MHCIQAKHNDNSLTGEGVIREIIVLTRRCHIGFCEYSGMFFEPSKRKGFTSFEVVDRSTNSQKALYLRNARRMTAVKVWRVDAGIAALRLTTALIAVIGYTRLNITFTSQKLKKVCFAFVDFVHQSFVPRFCFKLSKIKLYYL